jgi:uncharacterized protein YndB with AHSA1/START domain
MEARVTGGILNRLKFGSGPWNRWRQENPDVAIVLDGADLNGMILTGVNFSRASLRGASLHATNLMNADLRYADMTGANLVEADLIAAKLEGAILTGANLREADLLGADMAGARCSDGDLKGALHVPLFARVSHRFTVPAERVYDAFLDVTMARRFLYASPTGEIVRAELDPHVGGAYVITDRRTGADVEHTGTYLELDRPRRIVFTMFVPGYSTSPDRVTVEIVPIEGGCEVALTHEMLPDYAPYVDATIRAYTDHLSMLETVLA